jgi:hypothetical protein
MPRRRGREHHAPASSLLLLRAEEVRRRVTCPDREVVSAWPSGASSPAPVLSGGGPRWRNYSPHC